MAIWTVPTSECVIPSNLALLDTNVLIAYIDTEDPDHEDTVAALDFLPFSYGVLYSNLVEAWNWLTGKLKRPHLAYQMMDWILTPGTALLLEDLCQNISKAHGFSSEWRVDIVDASMIDFADRLSRSCSLEPATHVITYDTRDFLKLFGTSGRLFHVYDIRHLSSTSSD